jgi:TRAP-type C4-dicarboxylate transport system substrate-binding protein
MMSSVPVVTPMRYYDSAKYYLETGHAMVVSMSIVSKLWFDKLSPDVQKIVVDAGRKVSAEIGGWALDDYANARAGWLKGGGEVTTISDEERAQVNRMMASIGPEVSSRKPEEKALYELLVRATERTLKA